jgi:dihydroorotate dehydrogenase (fumarate)
VRGAVNCPLAVKLPPQSQFAPRALADLLKSLHAAIAVCQNDLPKELDIDLATGAVQGRLRALSHAHAMYLESENLLDIVAVGGINSGRDAYVAHLSGAKGLQVGSALIKEGAGALGRIDRELAALLVEHAKRSVSDIVGQLTFRQA